MAAGEDVEGMLEFGEIDSKWSMLIGQAVWLELFGRRNPVFLWLQRKGWSREKGGPPLSVRFASKHQDKRRRLLATNHELEKSATLTDKLLLASKAHPDIVGDSEVLAMGISIAAAGSDATAISLSALFYHLLKNPKCYAKLTTEIDAVLPVSETTLSFNEAQGLPYLSACVKESTPAASGNKVRSRTCNTPRRPYYRR